MEILAAALAFSITMLVLAMVVSAFVEVIHRIFSMREAGLKYMLEQMFEQVLKKPIANFKSQVPTLAQKSIDEISASFVERMSSNRAPMGATPKDLPTGVPVTPGLAVKRSSSTSANWQNVKNFVIKILQAVHLWNGRDLASMTPSEFMERLGSTDFGTAIKAANDRVGAAAADVADAVLKDIAQKFEAVGKEAGDYFEGRARLLSVAVAVVLAFAVHVDAIELFNTYLKNPTVREAVNGKLDAVIAQYKSTQQSVEKAAAAAVPQTGQAPAGQTQAPACQTPAPACPPPTPPGQPQTPSGQAGPTAPADQKPDPKKQFEDAQKQWQDTLDNTKKTITDLSDIGVPIGWNDARRAAAKMKPIVYTCPEATNPFNLGGNCKKPDIWIQVPTVPSVYLYLFIGGLLIGLGGPFWYNAITSITSIRNALGSAQGTGSPGTTGGAARGGAAESSETPQPVTPVDIFKVAHQAKIASDPPSDTSGSSTPKPDTPG
jgi:hypothetical protein